MFRFLLAALFALAIGDARAQTGCPAGVSIACVATVATPTASSASAIATSATPALAASLVLKAGAGNLYGATVTTGSTPGYLLITNTATVPTISATWSSLSQSLR